MKVVPASVEQDGVVCWLTLFDTCGSGVNSSVVVGGDGMTGVVLQPHGVFFGKEPIDSSAQTDGSFKPSA